MHPYVASLKQLFGQNADPLQAAPMKRYMRDQFEYLGIKSPLFKSLMKEFIAAHGTPPIYELDVICVTCGHSPSGNSSMLPQV